MASNTLNRVVIAGEPIRKKGVAAAAISPGDLLARSTSVVGTVLKHATAGGTHTRLFALENDIVGGDLNDAYATGDQVQIGAFAPGMEVNAWVAAAATAITLGARVEADATGGVRIFSAGTQVGTALEAVDNSGGGSRVRIRIELV